jgi:hypothetical protein
MMNVRNTEETMFTQPKAYCYNNDAKMRQSRSMRAAYRKALKALNSVAIPTEEYGMTVHFNPGGIAVWGETYAKITRNGFPVVEAYDTSMGLLVRQWDGRNSGRNHYVTTLDQFVNLVLNLANTPFVRF